MSTGDWFLGVSDTVVIWTVGVSELEVQEESHRIYPNPCNTDYVFLDYDTKQNQNVHLFIYSVTGKLINQQKLRDSTTHRISISNLKSGTYFYQIRDTIKKSDSVSGKLIVE